MGRRENAFSSFFFGGFGNNWVDWGEVRRYRDEESFPGLELNETGGTDFAKGTVEWTLPPMRFRRVGVPGLYTNWARLALFSSGLATDLGRPDERREMWNAGAQVDFSLVLFSTLESTFSVGYAQAFEHGSSSDEVMISLSFFADAWGGKSARRVGGGVTDLGRVVLALFPVSLFLASLVWLDSYKLVRLRSILRMIAAGALAASGQLDRQPHDDLPEESTRRSFDDGSRPSSRSSSRARRSSTCCAAGASDSSWTA